MGSRQADERTNQGPEQVAREGSSGRYPGEEASSVLRGRDQDDLSSRNHRAHAQRQGSVADWKPQGFQAYKASLAPAPVLSAILEWELLKGPDLCGSSTNNVRVGVRNSYFHLIYFSAFPFPFF